MSAEAVEMVTISRAELGALKAELHLPADHVTIRYTVTPNHGQEVIAIQLVRPDA
jgi:hypothetical protein